MTIDKLIVFSETGDKNTDDLILEQGFPSKLQPARQWHNWLFNKITLKINEVVDAVTNVGTDITKLNDARIGSITQWLSLSIPDDSLEIKGQTISKVDYPKLFQAYGISTNTLTLPDTRGEFVRGLDNGRDIDAGREIGSAQGEMIKSHNHTLRMGGDGNSVVNTNTNNAVTTANQPASGASAGSVQIDNTDGVETRPRNIAMIYIIKVK